MTGDTEAPDGESAQTRQAETDRAEIETVHADPVAATVVARAVRPDNTDAMNTETDGEVVRTTIERGTTGGLNSSVDDYVVNVDIATQIITTTRNL